MRITEALVAWFEARGTTVVAISDATFSAPAQGENGEWILFANAREEQEQVLIHSTLPDAVPADRRVEMALFLTRANFGLVIGSFELDLSDGELRYKTSVDVEGSELTDAMIDRLMTANVATFDQHLPSIRAVLDGASGLDVEA